jgi:hypothetical protein
MTVIFIKSDKSSFSGLSPFFLGQIQNLDQSLHLFNLFFFNKFQDRRNLDLLDKFLNMSILYLGLCGKLIDFFPSIFKQKYKQIDPDVENNRERGL